MKIQQNIFTHWCNEHLKYMGKRNANLLDVLSQKKMHHKHNQRPTFCQIQLENMSVALEFLD